MLWVFENTIPTHADRFATVITRLADVRRAIPGDLACANVS